VDLAIACAVASAERRVPVDSRTAVFGEVGLAGEVRGVPLAAERLVEAHKLGFARAVLPRHNRSRVEAPRELELVGVDTLQAALEALMGR
jgi:DNA repair protein RadA/Sms